MKPELVQKARDLMARASIIAERKSSNPNKGGPANKPTSTPPTGYGSTTVQEIHAMFARCRSDEDLEDALVDAERELADIQRTPAANEDEIDRRRRLLREGEGKDADEVARWECCPVKEIWAIRRVAGRWPGDGRKMTRQSDYWADTDGRRVVVSRIKRLEPDLSHREIGFRLKVSHPTINQDVRSLEDKAA
jgi:hypothetical protein